jgi:hypothetical protein
MHTNNVGDRAMQKNCWSITVHHGESGHTVRWNLRQKQETVAKAALRRFARQHFSCFKGRWRNIGKPAPTSMKQWVHHCVSASTSVRAIVFDNVGVCGGALNGLMVNAGARDRWKINLTNKNTGVWWNRKNYRKKKQFLDLCYWRERRQEKMIDMYLLGWRLVCFVCRWCEKCLRCSGR